MTDDSNTTAASRVQEIIDAFERNRWFELDESEVDDLRTVLAEHREMRHILDGLATEYALQVDGLTIASGTEEFVREFDYTRPDHTVVQRLVGKWQAAGGRRAGADRRPNRPGDCTVTTRTAFERLEQTVEQHPHSPASTRVTLTLGDARDLRARILWLEAELSDATGPDQATVDRVEREYFPEDVLRELRLRRVRRAHKGGA